MKKKFLCIVLIFVLALSVVGFVSCNTSINGDKLVLELNEEGNGYIVCDVTNKKLTKVVLPETYNGLPIVSIGKRAFDGCEKLTSLTISDGVTTIGFAAFVSCFNLTDVYYTGDIESWCKIDFASSASNPLCNGANLYINNELVTELIIPDNVTTLKDCAFAGYTSLTRLTIPNNVKSIEFAVFQECKKLTNVTVGSGVTTIGEASFRSCEQLTSITISNSVTTIDCYAFERCRNLTEIKFNGTVAQWNAIEKGKDWNDDVPATKVICTDGEVALQ